jgi:putative ABC transport system permease protein
VSNTPVLQDLRFAVRLLAKDRRFTIAAVVALALGIGVNNSVFTLINTALIRKLPFEEPDRLLTLRTLNQKTGRAGGFSYAEYIDYRNAVTSLTALAASVNSTLSIGEPGRAPERVHGAFVSANVFSILGRSPFLGRSLTAEDEQPGSPAVVILSESLWRNRYGSDPAIVGRMVLVDDVPATVVGVMPRGFKYPLITQVWQPLRSWTGLASDRRSARSLTFIGRLRNGVGVADARADLEGIARQLAQSYPATNADIGLAIEGLLDGMRQVNRPILMTIMGAVGLVLLTACANIAILLLARSASRSREIAVRVSLGATRWRIVRQLLAECVLLSVMASILGAVLSTYGAQTLGAGFNVVDPGAAAEDTTPYWVDLTMNRSAYVFVGLAGLFSTFAFGLVPALHLARTNIVTALKDGSAGTGFLRAQRWTSGLIVVQLAFAVALVAAAGLLWRSFVTTTRADLVVETADIVTARFTLPAAKYGAERRTQFLRELDERVHAASSLAAVTIASSTPFDPQPSRIVSIEGHPLPPGEAASIGYIVTDHAYFETLRHPIVRGRAFRDGDDGAGGERAIVNERFVRALLPEGDPIGTRIRVSDRSAPDRPSPWFTIVGVARTIPGLGRGLDTRPIVYVPMRTDPEPPATMTLMARGSSVSTVASILREELRAMDASVPLYGLETLETAVGRAGYPQRLLGTWFGLLAAIALVLASVGVYATTAHSVTRRTQEIGVRLALGAPAARILSLFMRRAAVHLAIGLALGAGGALVLGRLLSGFLVNTSPRDAATLTTVIVLLAVVALVASYLPARRATRVDPMVSLRSL